MKVYWRLKVLKLVVSAHICVSTQNEPLSLQCCWQVLKRVSFALNEWMPSLLYTSWKCFKTAQKQVYKKKHEYGKYLRCASLLGTIFSDFRDASTGFPNQWASVLASTTNLRCRKSIWAAAHVLLTQIHKSLGHCLVYKTVLNDMSTFLLTITCRTIAFSLSLNAGTFERLEWLSNTKPATWLAEGHVISNKTFISHLASYKCFNVGWCNNASVM